LLEKGAHSFKNSYKQVLCVGLVVITTIVLVLWNNEVERLDFEFQNQADQLSNQIKSQLKVYSTEVEQLVAFFDASSFVSDRDFILFTKDFLAVHGDSVNSVFFAQSITDRKYRRLLTHQRRILKKLDYRIFPGGRRLSYLLIVYLRPNNQDAEGLDLLAPGSSYVSSIERARDSGQLTQSALVKDIGLDHVHRKLEANVEDSQDEDGQHYNLILQKAVYRDETTSIT